MNVSREWQFDGLVGPTHNYSGLALGNLAAQNNAGAVSNPRLAALQGLEKMRFVRELGVPQAFIPPQYRPLIPELERLGFKGNNDTATLKNTADYSPALLSAVYSSSFMWTANAATVTPSCDSADGKVHFTPANMSSHFHRAIEARLTRAALSKIFHNTDLFQVHNHLFHHDEMGDEGAANHMLVSQNHGLQGTHIFVYGESHKKSGSPVKFPARQQLLASEAIARSHTINKNQLLFLQQLPEVIDQGVFHNDVIAMNTTRRMVVHERSFIPEDQQRLREFFKGRDGFRYREITDKELPVADAVATYLFNSQLLDLGDDRFALIAPGEAEKNPKSAAVIQQLIAEGILSEVHYKDLRESMRNGGGPACLRLRVVLSEKEAAAIHQGVVLTDAKYTALKQWVETYYRDRLSADDLRDPAFLEELREAYLALEPIIDMPGYYGDAMMR